jgi:hypothetical protein
VTLAAARSIIRATVVKGEPRSLTNTKGEGGLSRWPGTLQFIALDRVHARGPVLDPADVKKSCR